MKYRVEYRVGIFMHQVMEVEAESATEAEYVAYDKVDLDKVINFGTTEIDLQSIETLEEYKEPDTSDEELW